MDRKVGLRCRGKTFIIWISTEGEGGGIKFRLPFKIFSTLHLQISSKNLHNKFESFDLTHNNSHTKMYLSFFFKTRISNFWPIGLNDLQKDFTPNIYLFIFNLEKNGNPIEMTIFRFMLIPIGRKVEWFCLTWAMYARFGEKMTESLQLILILPKFW